MSELMSNTVSACSQETQTELPSSPFNRIADLPKSPSEYFELPGPLMNSALVESQFDPAREVSYPRFQWDSNFSFSSASVDESMEDPGLSLT